MPDKNLRELEAIRERAGLQSVSDVVRDAITAYLHDEESSWNSEKIKAIVPNALMEDVEMFITSGDATDISQAVTLALAGWVEEKKRYYLEGKEAIRQKVGEAIDQRATRKGMARSAAHMRVQ